MDTTTGLNFIWLQRLNKNLVENQTNKNKKIKKFQNLATIDDEKRYSMTEDLYKHLHAKFFSCRDVERLEKHQIRNLGKTHNLKIDGYLSKELEVLERDLDVLKAPEEVCVGNKLPGEWNLGFKKSLHYNMQAYYKLINVIFHARWAHYTLKSSFLVELGQNWPISSEKPVLTLFEFFHHFFINFVE